MIKPLTSLRFIFALMVFFSHLGLLFDDLDSNFLKDSMAKYIYMPEGYIGVSFFFILSGFVLSYSYKERIINGEVSFKNFMIARFARIYPLHVVTLLFAFLMSVFYVEDIFLFIQKTIVNLFLVQSFVPSRSFYFSFNGVSWSISNEMFFYFLLPFLLIFISKAIKNVKIITATLFIPILILFLFKDSSNSYWIFNINPFFRLFDFIIGILLYEVFNKFMKVNLSRYLFSLIELGAIIVFILFFLFRQNIHQSYLYSVYYWIPMSIIIFVFAFQKGVISSILSHRFLIYLGEISFAFYMIHQLVIKVFWAINLKLNLVTNGYLLIALAFLLSLIGAGVANKIIEKPLNHFFRNKYIK